ncbi:hypothetical protein CGRA01v4_06357 [Colletotrichum graminicola]|nr:hypothetical protein CGRA01v4_06357 [Colletotrichum graminicola]
MHVRIQYSYFAESTCRRAPVRFRVWAGQGPDLEVPTMPHHHYQMETAIVKHCQCLTPSLPRLPSRGPAWSFVSSKCRLERRPTRCCRCCRHHPRACASVAC